MLGNGKGIFISFSYLLWCWNVCSPRAFVNEFVYVLLWCYQWSGTTIIFAKYPALSSCVALTDFHKWNKGQFCNWPGAGHGILLAPVCRYSIWYFIFHVLPEASLESSRKRLCGCCGHLRCVQDSSTLCGFVSFAYRLSGLSSFLTWLPSVLALASLRLRRKNALLQGLRYRRWPEPLCSLDLIPLGSSAGKRSADLCGDTLWGVRAAGEVLLLPYMPRCFHWHALFTGLKSLRL